MFDFHGYIRNTVYDIRPCRPEGDAAAFFLEQARMQIRNNPPSEKVIVGAQEHLDVQASDRSAIEFLEDEIVAALLERLDEMPN